MATKIFPNGTETVTVSSGNRISIMTPGTRAKVYQRVGYTNYPESWDLLTDLTANVEYVSEAFSADTQIRIEAGTDYVLYTTTLNNVGVPNGATVTATERTEGFIHQTTLTLTATPVTITDDAGVAQYGGTGKIYDLPEGAITFLGCVVDGDLTLGTTGTIIATYDGDVALGTATATTGATLTGTEADIMASNAITQAVAKVAAVSGVSTAATIVDGTSTAKDVFLNFVIDDDATHTDGTGTFTGTVTMLWANTGDVA